MAANGLAVRRRSPRTWPPTVSRAGWWVTLPAMELPGPGLAGRVGRAGGETLWRVGRGAARELAMDAIEALKTRRSVRAYTAKPVAKEVLEDLVDCARMAPTAMNVQPWRFVVVTNPDTRRTLADLCEYGGFLAEAPACIAIVGDEAKFVVQDTACAATYLLVAARAHGLCGCWVHVWGKEHERDIARVLQVPPTHRVICLLAVGHGELPVAPPKKPLDQVLSWGTYQG